MLMDLFEEAGFIKINEKNSAFYMIEFLGIDDISKVMDNPKFAQVYELSLECEEFQKSLLEDNLEEIIF